MFHFRRSVPADLHLRLGRSELVRSLATGDARTAKLRAAGLYVASEHLFDAARSAMLTADQLARLVQDFYATLLEQDDKIRLSGGFFGDQAREARIAHYAAVADRAKDALACNRLDEAAWVTEAMLRKQGIVLSSLTPAGLAQAKQALLRAGVDLAETLRARFQGDFNYEPRDALLKQKLANTPPTTLQSHGYETRPAPPIGQSLSEAGFAFREAQVATQAWDRQTAAQAGATYRLFIDICGDKPLGAYMRKDVGHFRDQIERLPNDYGKSPVYRGMSVASILAWHGARPTSARSPLITQKTVKRHFSALSALWTAAVPKGEVTENIFSGFRFAGAKKASEQRDMWERDELARLFSTPIWRGCESPARRTKPGSQWPAPIRWPRFEVSALLVV